MADSSSSSSSSSSTADTYTTSSSGMSSSGSESGSTQLSPAVIVPVCIVGFLVIFICGWYIRWRRNASLAEGADPSAGGQYARDRRTPVNTNASLTSIALSNNNSNHDSGALRHSSGSSSDDGSRHSGHNGTSNGEQPYEPATVFNPELGTMELGRPQPLSASLVDKNSEMF